MEADSRNGTLGPRCMAIEVRGSLGGGIVQSSNWGRLRSLRWEVVLLLGIVWCHSAQLAMAGERTGERLRASVLKNIRGQMGWAGRVSRRQATAGAAQSARRSVMHFLPRSRSNTARSG